MAPAKSSENEALDPVDGPANDDNEHLSDNDGIAVGSDIDEEKKGKTKRQKVANQETIRQKAKNQAMFKAAGTAVSGFRIFPVILVLDSSC